MSRKFSKELGRSLVVETSQTGAIVAGDEGVEAGIAFGMTQKAAVMGNAVLLQPGKMLAEAAVEALDHAVGLRPEGLGEAVGDGARGADPGEGVVGSTGRRHRGGLPARYGARMDAELARQRGHGRRCSAGYRRGSVGWWWHWRAAEVASGGAPPCSSQGQALGRRAHRRDGVTRTLAPMGFQGMRKSTMMPNAQPRPRTATLASIAKCGHRC